jgi:spore germination protein YaaH
MSQKVLVSLCLLLLSVPVGASAYRGEVAGWVPWFQLEEGMASALRNVDELDTVYLFVYELDEDGQLVEKSDFDTREWRRFIRQLERERVDIIPTIAWFDGEAIHETLSNRRDRRALVRDLEDLVDDNDYDGIDIDFEQKKAETIDDFSDFLEELGDALGRDDLVCTIEPRMRSEHRWRPNQMPATIEYANDYRAINKHCDRIQIMAFDQQRADVVLNNKRRGVPYAPVADTEWVEHVLEFALEDFDADKTILGIPTYGRAWDVTVAPEWYRDYTRVASLNQPRIIELAEKYDAPIGRTEAGEGVITYFPDTSPFQILSTLPVPKDTPRGFEAAAKALLFADLTGMEVPVRFVTWSDAQSVEEKLELAEKYKLEGVSLFKIDGEEDPAIWELL